MTRRAKKRLALLLGSVALCGIAVVSAYSLRQYQRTRLADGQYQRGMEAFERQDYEATLANLGGYLGRNPDDTTALYAVAEAHLNVPQDNGKHIREAISYAKAASISDPMNPEPLELLLKLYAIAGFLHESEQTAEKLLAIDPTHYRAMAMIVEANAQRGRTVEALAAARQMAEAHPDDLVIQNSIVRLMQDAELPDAEILEYIDGLIAEQPDRVEFTLLRMVRLLSQDARANEATVLESAKKAIAMEFPDARSLNQMLTILDRLRRPELADTMVSRLLQDPDKVRWAAVTVAERAWKAEEPEQARQYIEMVSDVAPEEADVQLLAWRLFLQEDTANITTPDATMRALLDHGGPEAASWARVLEARAAIESNEWIEARDHLTVALETRPNNRLARFLLGDVSNRLGEWRAAESAWTDVISAEPAWLRPRLALASLLLREGRIQRADEIAFQTGRLHPTNWRAAWMVAQTSIRLLEEHSLAQERIGLLENYLRSTAEQATDRGEPTALLARLYIATDRNDDAQRVIRQLLDRAPEIETSDLLRLAEVSRDAGIAEVEQLVAMAGESTDTDPRVLFAQATRLAEQGDTNAGETLIRQAVSNAPNNEGLRHILAVFLDRTDHEEAAQQLAALSADFPQNADAQLALLEARAPWLEEDERSVVDAIARLRHLTGDDATGWRLFEVKRFLRYDRDRTKAGPFVELMARTLRREPDNWEALVSMADLMIVTDPRDPAPAIQYLNQAVDSNPNRPDLLIELVRLHLRAGDANGAKRRLGELRRVTELSPDQLRARADLHWEAGLWDEAISDISSLADAGEHGDLIRLARMLASRGQPSDADATIDRLLEAGPTEAPVVAAAADFLAQRDRIAEATALFESADTGDSPTVTIARARFLATHGDQDAGEQMLASLARTESSPVIWLELAHLQATAGAMDRVTDTLNAAKAAFPDSEPVDAARTIVQMAGAQNAAVVTPEPFIRALITPVESQPAIELVELLERHPEPDEARETAVERLTERYPNFYIAWHILAVTQAGRGEVATAIETARRAALIFPADARPLRIAVSLLSSQKRYADALVVARQWHERVLADPLEAELVLAELSNAAGRHDEAVRWLEPQRDRLVADADAHPERLELLVSSLAFAGRSDDARAMIGDRAADNAVWARISLRAARSSTAPISEIAEWIESLEPVLTRSDEDRMLVAQAWFDLAATSKADAHHDRLFAVSEATLDNPKTAGRAQLLRAMSLHQRDRDAEALVAYEAAAEQLEDEPFILNNIAYLTLDVRGDASTAAEIASEAVDRAQTRGKVPHAYLDTLAYALIANDQPGEAEEVLRRAQLLDPTDRRTLAGIAISLALQDQAGDATTFLREIPTDSLREHTTLQTAQHFENRERPELAEQFYSVATTDFPESPAALNNHAYLLTKLGRDLDQAVLMSTRAIQAAGSQGAPPAVLVTLLDTLGLANAASGDHPAAEAAFRRGLELDPNDVKLLVGLAESLKAQGREDEATPIIERIPRSGGALDGSDPLQDRILSLVGGD